MLPLLPLMYILDVTVPSLQHSRLWYREALRGV